MSDQNMNGSREMSFPEAAKGAITVDSQKIV